MSGQRIPCTDCDDSFEDDYDWVVHLSEQHPGAWERWYHSRWREQSDYRRAEAAQWR